MGAPGNHSISCMLLNFDLQFGFCNYQLLVLYSFVTLVGDLFYPIGYLNSMVCPPRVCFEFRNLRGPPRLYFAFHLHRVYVSIPQKVGELPMMASHVGPNLSGH